MRRRRRRRRGFGGVRRSRRDEEHDADDGKEWLVRVLTVASRAHGVVPTTGGGRTTSRLGVWIATRR